MSDFQIRPFQKEDINEVMNINLTCLPEHYPSYFYYEVAKKWPEGFLVATVNKDIGFSKIVGYCMIRVEKKFRKLIPFHTAHLLSIAILVDYRKQGIASTLIKRAYNGLNKNNKICEVFLEVRKSNQSAISLYKKLGFKIVKTKPRYYSDGEDALIMINYLSSSK